MHYTLTHVEFIIMSPQAMLPGEKNALFVVMACLTLIK